MDQGEFDEADAMYRKVLEGQRRSEGENAESTATTYHNLGSLELSRGNFGKAVTLYDLAEERLLVALGEVHPKVAATRMNRANAYFAMRDYKKAAAEIERAMELGKRVWGEEHGRIADMHQLRSAIRGDVGDLDGAEADIRIALEMNRRVRGPHHATVASTLDGLANALESRGKRAEALEIYKEALAIWERIGVEKNGFDVAYVLNNLGYTLQHMDRFAEAEPYMARAVEIRRKLLPPDHPLLVASIYNLAWIYYEWGRHDEALPHWRESIVQREMRYGADHSRTLAARERMAESLTALDRKEEARAILEDVLKRRERLGDEQGAQWTRKRLATASR
jgi:tetratricopeptide (TPR) repeat protein